MSNSVLFLLAAVALSIVGTFAVWLHGRPRRPKSSVDHFAQNLRALSMQRGRSEPPSGVTPLPPRTIHERTVRSAPERTRPGS